MNQRESKPDIDRRLDHVLEVLVRLEHRLETAGVLHDDDKYGDDATRFALEHNIERDPKAGRGQRISAQYVSQVEDWLQKHEGDPQTTFIQLEDAFGHEERGRLMDVLQYFYMQGMWRSIIQRLEASGAIKGQLTDHPYKRAYEVRD